MAHHIRRQVREAVVAALSGLPTTGSRVKTAHPFPLDGPDLPGLVILADEEAVEVDSFGGPSLILARTLRITVLGYAVGVDVENTLDAMAAEVEAAIAAAFPVGGALVRQMVPTGTTMQVDGDARTRAGELRLVFEAMIRTTAADPTATA